MKVKVCRLEDIPRLGARRYQRADGKTIAIFRNAGDKVFALHDRCPHKGGPLSQGIVFGESVACPLHNWCIDLNSGSAAAPDEGMVERFEVEVVNGQVELALDRHPGPGQLPIRGELRPDSTDWAPACAGATK